MLKKRRTSGVSKLEFENMMYLNYILAIIAKSNKLKIYCIIKRENQFGKIIKISKNLKILIKSWYFFKLSKLVCILLINSFNHTIKQINNYLKNIYLQNVRNLIYIQSPENFYCNIICIKIVAILLQYL